MRHLLALLIALLLLTAAPSTAATTTLEWTAASTTDATPDDDATRDGAVADIVAHMRWAARHVDTTFTDNKAEAGKTYYYALKTEDKSTNLSDYSEEISCSPAGGNTLLMRLAFEGNLQDATPNGNHGAAPFGESYTEGKNGEQFTLELTMMISMDKEGDSTILFRNSEGIPLAEITFTLCEYQGKRTMFIGGLQGAKWEIPHQEIQNATKACHGLFPKRLVMEAACLFAQRLQVEQIIAVSNETHIYRSLRYRDKEGKIHADYNAFWESVGGVCDAERHYRLPAQIARKEIAEIASKKRAEYRRRYEMLDAIQPQMATMFCS